MIYDDATDTDPIADAFFELNAFTVDYHRGQMVAPLRINLQSKRKRAEGTDGQPPRITAVHTLRVPLSSPVVPEKDDWFVFRGHQYRVTTPAYETGFGLAAPLGRTKVVV